MKKILTLLFLISTALLAQQPQPLYNSYFQGITSTRTIDNRSQVTGQMKYVSIACSGTGTWSAGLSYGSTSTGSFTAFPGSSTVTNSSSIPIAQGFLYSYPNFIRVTISGTVSCDLSGFNKFYLSNITQANGTVSDVTVQGTSNQITASGGCAITTTGTCVLSIPSSFTLPGTINKYTLTPPATGATLTIGDGKTARFNNTITFNASSDGIAVTFPGTGTAALLNSNNIFTGRQDLSGALSTAPAKTGSSLPLTCSVGDQYFLSTAPAGQNLYGCTSTNTWTQLSGSGTVSGLTANRIVSAYDTTTVQTAVAATLDPVTGDIVTPGTLTSGNGSGKAGAFDMAVGTVQAVPSNSFGWGAGTAMATSVRLQSPDAVPTDNSVMLFGAPSSNISTWTYLHMGTGVPTALAINADTSGGFCTVGGGACTGGGGGTAVAPYSTTVTAQTSVSISAATHGQGTLAIASCFDNSTPRVAVACDFRRNTSGDLTFNFSPAFTGLIQVGSGGGISITPYSSSVTAQTSVSISASTHGKGTTPTYQCLDNSATPVEVFCRATINGSGDLAFSFAPAFTGTILVRY